MSFTKRLIEVTVQLATNTQTNQPNTFSESGTDSVTLRGLRASVRIQNSGAPANSSAQIKVYGMRPSLMNQLSSLGLVFNLVTRNQVTVKAGDENSAMTPVFTGACVAAYGDYSAQPDVSFTFECLSGLAPGIISVPPTSFTGTADAATIMAGLAKLMNYGFENNGVSVTLKNSYYSGPARIQAQQCADEANITWGIINNKVCIWPLGGNRNTPNIPTISPATGMVGYPAFTQNGIIVKTVFNPLLSYGSLAKIESSVLSGIAQAQQARPASANFPTTWAINKLDHDLDSLVPKGNWLSTVYAYNPNYAKSIIAPGA